MIVVRYTRAQVNQVGNGAARFGSELRAEPPMWLKEACQGQQIRRQFLGIGESYQLVKPAALRR